MTGTIELDPDGRHLLIRFPYREDLVEEVRSLPGRRWDKGQKVWRVPADHAEQVVETFLKHGFELASDVLQVVAGTRRPGGPKPAGAEPSTAGDGARPLSVGELNRAVKAALSGAFPQLVQVAGEVLEFDKNGARGHRFFTLVEKSAVGDRIAARIEAVLFERTAMRVLAELERHGLCLRDGVEVLLEGRVDVWDSGGKLRLVVERIRPEFTLGRLAMSREQILLALRQSGAHETNLCRTLPEPSLRIAVLSSPEADGWADFERELRASGFAFDVTLHPIRVQGNLLKPTLLRGLDWFAERADAFDVLCIVRGGGSRTALAGFDDRDIAFAVSRHPLKVLCGIGHDRDRSVLDEITLSLKTPTAVAGFLVDCAHQHAAATAERARRVTDAATQALRSAAQRLTGQGERLQRGAVARLRGEGEALDRAGPRLARGSAALLAERERAAVHAARRAVTGASAALRDGQRRLDLHGERLRALGLAALERASARLDRADTRRRLLDPSQVLARGYALVRAADDGRVLASAAQLREGLAADIEFRDGRARTRVESVAPDAETSQGRDARPRED